MNHRIQIPYAIKTLVDAFKKDSKSLLAVGGAVRDSLLNKIPKDWDLATDANPDEIETIVNKLQDWKTLSIGKAFGIIFCIDPNNEQFEIATFRQDLTQGRKPEVAFTTIENDVLRRDLTINALFLNLDTNEVVDLVDGIEDLQNNIIRTVGDPFLRFQEDPLRRIRTYRFLGRMNGHLDPTTHHALKTENILNVSNERILDEWKKIISSSVDLKSIITLLNDDGYLTQIFKDLTLNISNNMTSDYILTTASILSKNTPDKSFEKQLNLLCWSIEDIRKITTLISLINFDISQVTKLKKKLETSNLILDQLTQWSNWFGHSKEIQTLHSFQFTVNGFDLMSQGFKGPELGKRIEELEIENFKKLL